MLLKITYSYIKLTGMAKLEINKLIFGNEFDMAKLECSSSYLTIYYQ